MAVDADWPVDQGITDLHWRIDNLVHGNRMRSVVIDTLRQIASRQNLVFAVNPREKSEALLLNTETNLLYFFSWWNYWSFDIRVSGHIAKSRHKELTAEYVFGATQTAEEILMGVAKDFVLTWFPHVRNDAPTSYLARYDLKAHKFDWAVGRVGFSPKRGDYVSGLSRHELVDLMLEQITKDLRELTSVYLDPNFTPSSGRNDLG